MDSQAVPKYAPKAADSLEILVDRSSNTRYQLIYRDSHSQPNHFVVVDTQTHKEYQVASYHPHLMNVLSSRLVEGRVTVEGLEIPYLLTLPSSDAAHNKRSPLLVMPHGGPIGVFDSRYFDLYTQYFAQQGFAVLRVNFRGSSGYTQALRDAGAKQFGDLILKDIYKATQEVAQRQDIDENKMCALGFSYGGYASTMLTVNYPDTYRCGVNVAGVSDINLYLNSSTVTKRQDTWLKKNIGDSLADYEKLKNQSPVYLAEKFTRPIYIIHGELDETVNVEHAYRLKAVLEKYHKPYKWKIYPEMDHSFVSQEINVDLFSEVIQFLKKELAIQ